jgi:hypothetical protein
VVHHPELDEEVAVRAARRPHLSPAAHLQPGAGVDTGGDVEVQGAPLAHPALAAALDAGVLDHAAVALTAAAGVRRDHAAEERAHLALHLPRAAADVAHDRGRAGLAARALAGAAEHRRVDRDLALRAEDHVAQLDVDADHGVVAALGARAGTPLPGAEAAEEGLEDVAEAARPARAAAQVVALPLVRIAQHVVGVGDVLEALSGLLAGVHIGVQLPRKPAVRLLDLIGRRIARHPECLVVVRHPGRLSSFRSARG